MVPPCYRALAKTLHTKVHAYYHVSVFQLISILVLFPVSIPLYFLYPSHSTSCIHPLVLLICVQIVIHKLTQSPFPFSVPVMQNVTQLAYMPLRLECQGFVTNETVYWEYMNEPLEFEVAPTVYELSTGQLRHSGRYICRSQITNEKLTIFDVTINEGRNWL